MIARLKVSTVAALAAALVLAAPAGSASADRKVFKHQPDDRYFLSTTKTTVNYSKKALTIKAKGTYQFRYVDRVEFVLYPSPGKAYYVVKINNKRKSGKVRAKIFKAAGVAPGSSVKRRSCRGLTARLKQRSPRSSITIRIPQRCLGKKRSIGGATSLYHRDADGLQSSFADWPSVKRG